MPRGKAKSEEAYRRQLSGLKQFKDRPEALDDEKVQQGHTQVSRPKEEREGGYRVSIPVGEIIVQSDRERKFLRGLLTTYEAFDWTKHPDDLRKLIILELRFFQLEQAKANRESITLQTGLSNEIRLLKEKLGITKAQLGGEQETALGLLERMKADAREFINQHRGQFQWKCPHCGGMALMEAPHFAFDPHCSHGEWDPHGTFIETHSPQDCPVRVNYGGQGVWNADLAQLVTDGVLTPVQAAKVLKTSPIALLATAKEIGFDLGLDFDMNVPETVEAAIHGRFHRRNDSEGLGRSETGLGSGQVGTDEPRYGPPSEPGQD